MKMRMQCNFEQVFYIHLFLRYFFHIDPLAEKFSVGFVDINAKCVSVSSNENTQQYRFHRSEEDQNEAKEVSYTTTYITSCP